MFVLRNLTIIFGFFTKMFKIEHSLKHLFLNSLLYKSRPKILSKQKQSSINVETKKKSGSQVLTVKMRAIQRFCILYYGEICESTNNTVRNSVD